jgi:uncharacterized protein (DUF58 family)
MNLSPRGAVVTWFAAAAVSIGILLKNPFALLAAFISLAYLGLQAVRFRRFITALADKLSVKIAQTHLHTLVADNFRLDVVITNSHKLPVKILDSRPKVSSQLKMVGREKRAHTLPSGSEFQAEARMRSLSPGQFQVTKWIVVLEDKSALFTHNLAVPCSATVEVEPVIGRVEAKLQLGSLANVTRLGTGTDLARIREVVSQDDFSSIDWKSTARTGKFMKKEYYPETEPAVLFLVDTWVLGRWAQALVQLGKLFVTFLSSTPVGVILYDGRNVIDQLSPSTGSHSRMLILRSLLTGSSTGVADNSTQSGMRLNQELVELIRLLQSTSRNPPGRRVDVYAQSLLPYYQNDLAGYSLDLKRQGAFRALETILSASPMLVIVVSNYNRDTRGLCEGAILANASGHKVILAVVGGARDAVPLEVLALQETGIRVLQIGSADLANAIRQAIADIPSMRIRNPRQLQYSSRG